MMMLLGCGVLTVALLAEGVDRNRDDGGDGLEGLPVALLAEGVDRNLGVGLAVVAAGRSPSSRRAWIEITCGTCLTTMSAVALLAEGVDRNSTMVAPPVGGIQSPSSRRAWIEIRGRLARRCSAPRRPPRGGRG